VSESNAQRHISHELRTPMNHVIGYSELLIEEATDLQLASGVALLQQIRMAGKQIIARLNEVFANRSLPTHIPLNGARDELRGMVETIDTLTGQVRAFLPEDLHTDLTKIELAGTNFLKLIEKFSAPPEDEEPTLYPAVRAYTPRETASIHPGRLLVVDDNPDNRDVLKQLLSRQGHTIGLAENGKVALEMMRSAAWDLVLLDIMMPIMDGYEALRQIKADEKLRDVPVIVVSALDEIQSVVRCIEMGAEDYLTKPFDPTLLRARLNASLERHYLREAELRYLAHVSLLTYAAKSVEEETFEPETISEVMQRDDALGNLARVFNHMAHEVYTREMALREQAREIDLLINEEMKSRKVEEITGSEFFQRLKKASRRLGGTKSDGVISPA
jgi:DNA-binding response OmpR family regulator